MVESLSLCKLKQDLPDGSFCPGIAAEIPGSIDPLYGLEVTISNSLADLTVFYWLVSGGNDDPQEQDYYRRFILLQLEQGRNPRVSET